ncbi:MAG: prepilin-type N-terminal cleavage/methylation domain-containing protein [Planctomycetota bacterium]
MRVRPTDNDGTPAGFTLIEMLVAVSITSILLLLVARVFNDTSRAIGDSMDVSQVLGTTRVMSDQLFDDGSRIITAKANEVTQIGKLEQPGGFLVIVQQRNSGVRFPDPADGNRPGLSALWTADADNDGTPNEPLDDLIRTDQLVFFREGTRVESLTPANTSRYDSDARAPFIRVWYGHLGRPTFNSGGLLTGSIEPGQDGNDTTNDLVLGRQALLILDNNGLDPGSGSPLATNDPNTAAPFSKLLDFRSGGKNGNSFDLVSDIDITGRIYDGASGSYDTDRLWYGTSDVMTFGHAGIDQASAGIGWSFKSLFDKELASAVPGPDATDGQYQLSPYTTQRDAAYPIGNNAIDANLLPTDAYHRSALTWGFLRAGNRLVGTADVDYPYDTDTVARTHGFFSPYVSDFVVEFAADIRDDLGDNPLTTDVETDVNIDNGATLDNLADGTPDTVSSARNESVETAGEATARMVTDAVNAGIRIPAGSVKWYTADHLVNNPLIAISGQPASYEAGNYPAYNPDKPITWPIPRGAAVLHTFGAAAGELALNDYPPYVGYVTNPFTTPSSGGRFSPSGPTIAAADLATNMQSRAVFIFGHTGDKDYNAGSGARPPASPPYPTPGDGLPPADTDGFEVGSNKWWPYMLRVRYRLHDGDGSFGSVESISNDRIAGKWFEQIIAVPLK